jgi:hypothetical protein
LCEEVKNKLRSEPEAIVFTQRISHVMPQQYFPEIQKMPFLIGFVLAVFLVGCQATLPVSKEENGTKPAWTTAGVHPSYPSPRYIQGIGLAKASEDSAKDRQAADQNAFSEIINQISANVSSEFSVEKMVVTKDKAETVLGRATSSARIRSSVTLSGLTVVERYYDPQQKTYYSLGVLDRVSASEPHLQALNNFRQDYERYFKSAMEYRQQGKVFQSLLSLRDAYQAAYQYQERLPFYQLLAGRAGEIALETPPSPAGVLEKLTETLSHLEFQIAQGDRQLFVYGKPLPAPLVASLMLNDVSPTPAEGFPVTFSFHTGQGTLLSQTGRTDNQGMATAVVSQVKRTNDSKYSVAAEIEFHELRDNANDGGVWNSKIPADAKKVLFTFAPKKATGAVGVLILISDQNSGAGGILMRDELATHLSQAGFSPVSDAEIGAGQIQQNLRGTSIENLRKQIPRNVGAVILVEISASTSNNALGMIVYRINGLVKAYSVKDWQMIASESFQDVRGFGTTEEQARNDAYKNAGLEIADPLIGDFLSRYDVP